MSGNGFQIVPRASGGGGGVSGTGTVGAITRFTSVSAIGDSGLSDDGMTLVIGARGMQSSAAQTWTLATSASALSIAGGLLAINTAASAVTSTGPIRATGTSAATPAFTGADADTGMYFPAANQVRFATSGTLAMAIDASGLVSIGTATSVATRSLTTAADVDVYGVRVGRGGGAVATNTAVGAGAMAATATGTSVTAYGASALAANAAGSRNLGLGDSAGLRVASANDVAYVGYLSGGYNTGNSNSAFGSQAMAGVSGSSTGINNTAIGCQALNGLTTANSNLCAGYQAGVGVTSGGGNVLLGQGAGGPLTTGTNSICIGVGSAVAAAASTNEIAIGYGTTGAGSNTTTLGNSSTTSTVIPAGTLNLSTVAGQGAKLPAVGGSADAQTLDAYYEAVWTATLNAFTTTGTVTTSARYTTVGRTVMAEVIITTAAASTCIGVAASNISGLPVYATDCASAVLACINSTGASIASMVSTAGAVTFANFSMGASDKLKVVFRFSI